MTILVRFAFRNATSRSARRHETTTSYRFSFHCIIVLAHNITYEMSSSSFSAHVCNELEEEEDELESKGCCLVALGCA